jgi:two-component system sensor histidine kinase YesM
MRSKLNSSGEKGVWKKLRMDDWPIRYRLIMHFLLVSIIPAICLGFLIDWAADKIIERQVNNYTLQLIGNVNKSLEFYANSIQNVSYFISFQPEVQRFVYHETLNEEEDYEVRKFLQGITTLYTEVAGILLVNSEGEYISNEMYARTQRNLTEEDWYQQAVDNNGIFSMIGHPVGRNVTTHVNYKDEEVVSFVRAILDPETQQVKGVILIDLKLRVIAETVKDVRLGKTGYLMVVDDRGDTIYMPQTVKGSRFDYDWFSEKSTGIVTKTVSGEELQLIYFTSPFTNWTTVGVFPKKETVGEMREIRLYLATFVFVLCLLGIAASYYLSNTISRPIRQLMAMMRKAEDGNFSVRFAGGRSDEVGMLGRSFNAMLKQIDRLIDMVGTEQRKKREAELRSLQAQIKPHFLYNTLDTIQWLARKNGAHDVTEVVDSLSRLFRIGLSRGSEMITLQDEFEHIRHYLKIQKTRYKDKLNDSIWMDPALEHCYVIKLILQPIVENAIYHGIKERRGPGHIRITARREADVITIDIEDDGVGMTPEALQQLQRKLELERTGSLAKKEQEGEGGYGLLNVQERIRLSFGEPYGIQLHSVPGQGTKVTVLHPIMTADEVK